MRIVVTAAVRSECTGWRRFSGPAGDIHVVTTGIGMRGSRDQLRDLLAMPADFCIASGLGGSLTNRHAVGSIVVARGIKTEATTTILTSDGGLVDAAVRCGANPVSFFFTSKSIVNSPSERLRLSSGSDAIDMESFHVLAEARRAGVPAVAIRAISDTPDEPLPIDLSSVVSKRGDIDWLPLFWQLLKQPVRIKEFLRFSRASSNAAGNLARFLGRYFKFLAANEGLRTPVDSIAR